MTRTFRYKEIRPQSFCEFIIIIIICDFTRKFFTEQNCDKEKEDIMGASRNTPVMRIFDQRKNLRCYAYEDIFEYVLTYNVAGGDSR